MDKPINIPLNYCLPKHYETHLRFAEEIYLLDFICQPGENIEIQNIGDKWYIIHKGKHGDIFVEDSKRIYALRKLYLEIRKLDSK